MSKDDKPETRLTSEGRMSAEHFGVVNTPVYRASTILHRDLASLEAGAPELIRNTDIASELKRLGESADFQWITTASDGLAEVERGMRRNLLRSLSLDAFATALEKG